MIGGAGEQTHLMRSLGFTSQSPPAVITHVGTYCLGRDRGAFLSLLKFLVLCFLKNLVM